MNRATKLLWTFMVAWTAVTVIAAGSPRRQMAALTVADFAAVLIDDGGGGAPGSADQAFMTLVQFGVPLGGPGDPLTEGQLAAIMEFYGIRARTSSPGALVNAERGSAAAYILRTSTPSLGGTEKRRSSTPPETGDLDICLSEHNHGHCVNCCKELGSPANACASFCRDQEAPSPSAPR